MVHTWIEISREAFFHNIKNIKQLIGDVKLGVVLKADAYGHGLSQMALLAQEHHAIEYIFTALTSEALVVRASGVTKPLCVLVCCDSSLDDVLSNDIDLVCYDVSLLEDLNKTAQKLQKQARIHLKIDTGMSRLGILPKEIFSSLEKIQQYSHIKLVGIMTHLCDADNRSEDSVVFTQQQLTLFDQLVAEISAILPYSLEVVHACASAGTVFFAPQCSLVRIGECAYGAQRLVRVATNMFGYYKPNVQKERLNDVGLSLSLRPILTWKTRIIQVKEVPEGSVVGYNRTHITTQLTKIAVVPIGYFEGYPRALSNCGIMMVRGCTVPVIGRVSMNMCMLDVSHIEGVSVDDEVIIMGDYPGMTADEIAAKIGTINLDIFTNMHSAIRRSIV